MPRNGHVLTFTALCANSADDRLDIFLKYLFLENGISHFKQFVSSGDNLHKMWNPVLGKKKEKKYFSLLSVENFKH